MSITVAIADDHAMLREGLRSLLENRPDITVIGEAADGKSAVELAIKLKPQVMIMDISMPTLNGIGAMERIHKEQLDISVIILSMHKEERFVNSAFLAGAKGYLLKDSLFDELIQAVYAVSNGHFYLSPHISGMVVNQFKKAGFAIESRKLAPELTKREKEILQLLAEGYKAEEIGRQLFISPKTVEAHKRNIVEKLNLSRPIDLVKYAIREGLISVDSWLS